MMIGKTMLKGGVLLLAVCCVSAYGLQAARGKDRPSGGGAPAVSAARQAEAAVTPADVAHAQALAEVAEKQAEAVQALAVATAKQAEAVQALADAAAKQAEAARALADAMLRRSGAQVAVAAPPPFVDAMGMEFMLVPAGAFQMGSPEGVGEKYEHPRREVTISKPFYLGKHEVTQAQWEAVMGSNPSEFKGEKRPVAMVSWNDAREFIKRLNDKAGRERYRLPTEAEWEYAARAGGDGQPGETAWCGRPIDDGPRPVGGKKANGFGLHDMLGNVSEWVQDRYGDYSGASATDPQGPPSGERRVIRGSHYAGAAAECTAATRRAAEPDFKDPGIGFRLALEVED